MFSASCMVIPAQKRYKPPIEAKSSSVAVASAMKAQIAPAPSAANPFIA